VVFEATLGVRLFKRWLNKLRDGEGWQKYRLSC